MKFRKILTRLVKPPKKLYTPNEPVQPYKHPFFEITAMTEDKMGDPNQQGYRVEIDMPGAKLTPGVAVEIGAKLTNLLQYNPDEGTPMIMPRSVCEGEAGFNRQWRLEYCREDCILCGAKKVPCLCYDNCDGEYSDMSICRHCLEPMCEQLAVATDAPKEEADAPKT